MKMNIKCLYRIAACVFATLATASFAGATGIDVLVAQPGTGTQTVVGQVDKGVADGDVDVSVRIFESEMFLEEEAPGEFVWESEEPGFFTGSIDVTPDLTGTGAVAAADGLTVSVFEVDFAIQGSPISDLFYWDGSGSPSFAPAVGASFALEPEGVLGGGATVSSGQFDEHPDFLVETGGAAAPAGIYLASVEVELEGFDRSEPVYIVFATLDPTFLGLDPGASEEDIEEAVEGFLEPAVDWVEANVPEPSAALLAVLAATGIVARRNRS